ncbi:arabinosyltransferase domain-containing protein [Gordonia sp. X0973]|uniref:arabinosyltransferase domain-containing protein n=1 Tax=Gordonia sp. X0973 TaxID=2742602 RepID=UPI0026574EED|nr:arabinosyltransferase domain-containing protein [Gordonia sp. X0973]
MTTTEREDSDGKRRAPEFLTSNGYRGAKILAVVSGLLGAVLAIAMMVLPVDRTTAKIAWPENNTASSVVAPLVSYVATDMQTAVPCSAATRLGPDGGVLLSTIPTDGLAATARGLFIQANAESLIVIDRNVVILSAPRAAAQAAPDCRVVFRGDIHGVHAAIEGLDAKAHPGALLTYATDDHEMRPQIVGVYSDLTGAAPAGMTFTASIDTRYVTSPTSLKFWLMVIGIIATLVSLVALAILDSRDGLRHRRLLPAGWWKLTWLDGLVTAILLFWWFGGANTSDDGYNMTVGRITSGAGYADNYFRYFGVPQDPFGWHFQVISWMTHVSVAAWFMRLPALLLGLLGWWLISREVIPRLGRAVRNSTPAMWSGAFVFLAIWLPYNNGIRPEPAEAIGALLTWCCVERAIATRRLLPYAIAAIFAAFTLALAPGGLMAAAALLAGLRPIVKTLVSRHERDGWLPMLAPILAAGTSVLFMIFADQSVMPLITGNQVAAQVGPTLEWWQEPIRYYYLILQTGDGTLSRRIGILLMLFALFFVMFRLLRGRHPNGVARAPIWRLIAVTLGTMFFIAFTPTKWTHHFGVYAGIAGGLAAAAGALMAPALLHSRRNRAFAAAGVFLVTAMSMAGINMWWFVGNYGVPWRDRPVAIGGVNVSWLFLALAVATALLGLYYHFRDDYTDEQTRTGPVLGGPFKFAPMPTIATLLVLFMVASLAKGAWVQRDSWSWTKSNARAMAGNACALANDVLVAPDPSQGILLPAAVDGRPAAPVAAGLGAGAGFTPDGLPDPIMSSTTTDGTDLPSQDNPGAAVNESAAGGTWGGQGAKTGVNGSRQNLPFGLDPARTPVLGSYNAPGGKASLTTGWYQLPFAASQAPADRPLLTVAVAGSVEARDHDNIEQKGQKLVVEFGRREANGSVKPLGRMAPLDAGGAPAWRDLRFPLAKAPGNADVVRIVADDESDATKEWLAVTPPRVNELRTLNDVVGQTDPVFIDWLPGFVFPCQRPIAVRNGVLEVPKWRIMPEAEATRKNSQTWMAGKAGGPLGITEALLTPTLQPTYLRNNWGRDWGGLQRFTEIDPAPPAQIQLGTQREQGLWNLGPIRATGY